MTDPKSLYKKIKIGNLVLVEVMDLIGTEKNIHPLVKPLEIIATI